MAPPELTTPDRLDAADRRAVAALLADAFEHDPMQSWLFPDGRHRHRRLQRFYDRDIAHRLKRTNTVCLIGRSDAVAFWQPPGDVRTLPTSAAVRLAPSLVSVAFSHPLRALAILRGVLAHRPEEPHWYLTHLAVRPELQGQGLGRRLLDWGIERAGNEAVGVYLETANQDNLAFYASAGFKQVGMIRVHGAPDVWCLWRAAQEASSEFT